MTPTVSAARASWHTASLDSPVDGVPIRFAVLKPQQTPRQAVLILNGRSEWIEKYFELPDWMDLGDDTLWVTMDHRGQGGSGGTRSYVTSYEDYALDVSAVLEAVAEDLPYAIVSHSMGGLVALYGTLHGLLEPRALALSSPLLAMPTSPLPYFLAKPIARLACRTRCGQLSTGAGGHKRLAFGGNPLTRSLAGFNRVCQSPFPFVPPTFGWVEATFSACDAILDLEKIQTLKTPVRIIGGSHEQVINPAGWSTWCMTAAPASRAPIEFIRVNGGRHELLNEIPRIRQRAVDLLRSWLERHLLLPDS
ncbi:alpha/beta hydrolase [Oligoflexus tunisiensis]|uniref:alpha/beta hydrolase n=1 Tax=Oligoflexus tunisiensis TaxID=708132 RepID=UPI00159F0058|nr:alpha/beta hydrolase [Oligoflexus tunisiensis]